MFLLCSENPTSLARRAPTINPSPQFKSPQTQAMKPTSAAAEAVLLGIFESHSIHVFTSRVVASA